MITSSLRPMLLENEALSVDYKSGLTCAKGPSLLDGG